MNAVWQNDEADCATKPIRVVIADASLGVRRWLSSVIAKDVRLRVAGMAASAHDARAMIKSENPDVVMLGVALTDMSGLDFLSRVMRLRPMPVVMFSHEGQRDTDLEHRAIATGAVACIQNTTVPTQDYMTHLNDTLYAAVVAPLAAQPNAKPKSDKLADKILLIGASTGGVAAIETLLMHMPVDCPPIVIAQHMPDSFLRSFAKRLDRISNHKVDMCQDRDRLVSGCVRLAPSQEHQTCVAWHSGAWHIQQVRRHGSHSFCPSVDVLFASGVPWGGQVGAILLTGLGQDGARGMLALRRNGACTIAQSRESCVVYGMPGAALALNASQEEAPVDQIGEKLLARLYRDAPGQGRV